MPQGKITPSQELRIAWLAGIIDGEGSLGRYLTKQGGYILSLVVVNTDESILSQVEQIYTEHNITYSKYSRSKYVGRYESSHIGGKECFDIKVYRREDIQNILTLLIPHLVGVKKQRAEELVAHLIANPKHIKNVHICKQCKSKFTGVRRQFCTQNCWHTFARGKSNPNYRTGNHVTQV